MEQVIDSLVLEKSASLPKFHSLIELLSRYEQKQFLLSTIRLLSRRFSLDGPSINKCTDSKDGEGIGQAIRNSAALITSLMTPRTIIENEMGEWLTSTPCSNNLARTILAALAAESRQKVLDTSWGHFGDKLRIKHSPILQQECTAQVLLMTAGYIHRADPAYVFNRARSSVHTSGVSAHLGSSSPRVRFLGMVVGMAISQLVDQPETRMKFDDKDLSSTEGVWYSKLVEIQDKVGSISDLAILQSKQALVPVKTARNALQAKTPRAAKPMIVEVLDDDNDNEFPRYEKPDSDPEDEEEDPTLVQRNKSKAPVFVFQSDHIPLTNYL